MLLSAPASFSPSRPSISTQNPDAWLKKECSIRQLSFSLDQHRAGGGTTAPAHSYQPLLRIASLRAAALLPAFAWLEVRPGVVGRGNEPNGLWSVTCFICSLPILVPPACLSPCRVLSWRGTPSTPQWRCSYRLCTVGPLLYASQAARLQSPEIRIM